MKNVPNEISTKDLQYIKDMFNWNFVAMKKFDDYIENIENEEIAKKLSSLADMHFKNCNNLIKLLEGEANE